MTFKEYQKLALKTALPSGDQFTDTVHWALGISGEAGEVADKLKKVISGKNGKLDKDDVEEFSKELGDVLWYLAVFSHQIGLDFEDVANKNLAKLKSRKARGKIIGSGDNR